eukprot:CAMPEP_0178722872 /NCGR_PEP_ID=MMETSP0699-20121125/25232_1 /TAXON_ID=265572 /ORGANISM="Extubocellulus spinifer, Strain CCMP396" /LENGTH=164 /DNA_ID=CAMNT_0020373889 /DNA_START=263 /DNA_END=757 /DNA_ORIENTATION=-
MGAKNNTGPSSGEDVIVSITSLSGLSAFPAFIRGLSSSFSSYLLSVWTLLSLAHLLTATGSDSSSADASAVLVASTAGFVSSSVDAIGNATTPDLCCCVAGDTTTNAATWATRRQSAVIRITRMVSMGSTSVYQVRYQRSEGGRQQDQRHDKQEERQSDRLLKL